MDDDARDGAWMTYDELAASRGFTRRAAVRLTQRQRLRRQPGNDGLVRVWVPADLAKPSQRRPHHDDARALTVLEGAVVALREQLERAEARADRAESAITGERASADALRDQLDAVRLELRQAQQAAEERRQADDARKARGRLARLRAAWRRE
jgi:hypothetical protein